MKFAQRLRVPDAERFGDIGPIHTALQHRTARRMDRYTFELSSGVAASDSVFPLDSVTGPADRNTQGGHPAYRNPLEFTARIAIRHGKLRCNPVTRFAAEGSHSRTGANREPRQFELCDGIVDVVFTLDCRDRCATPHARAGLAVDGEQLKPPARCRIAQAKRRFDESTGHARRDERLRRA
ncbi:hypothetical protein [Pararobbsia silviterrae]|uniref:hypothetical protein n=1 Tax=Pararobbsia silviterrae TaxID=1792498 RepID=UPI0011C48212|nr:hypothetical protein [Pararobbsia silviterrae]